MYNERPFQTQIIEEDLYRTSKLYNRRPREKRSIGTVNGKAKAYLINFLDTSSIHGLKHIVAPRRHIFESLLWCCVIALSVFGTIYLSRATWIRYQDSPTVVSMDRDMFAWNTTFPCLTICPHKKIDDDKLQKYLESSSEPDKDTLKEFILSLVNGTYETFGNIPSYNGIPSDKYMELILNLSAEFKHSLMVAAEDINLSVEPIITEMGLCYSYNSKIAVYLSPDYILNNKWDLMETYKDTFYVHPLDGEVYARVFDFTTAYYAFIHGPLEIPDISTKFLYSDIDGYTLVYVTALTVYTAPEAAKLTVTQRKCRFFEENNLKHSAVFSYNMCRMECRIRLCLKYCQCVPHFYRRIGNEKVCDVDGLHCLAKYKDELYALQDKDHKKINCNCLPNCNDVYYVIQSNVPQKIPHLGTVLQWGIVTYPRMRYRRDIIFGFTDVLVAVGSMAGLFLGCSVLSFMEIVYFLTLRLVCYTQNNFKKTI